MGSHREGDRIPRAARGDTTPVTGSDRPPAARSLRLALAVMPYLIALGVFLALSLPQLDLPGLHYDEAREAGLPAMQMLRGLPVLAQRGATVNVLGRELPLMVQDYIGALQAFLAVPFLALFGATTAALRLMPVVAAAVTLLLTGRLAHSLYGPCAAWIAMLLLAVQPSFVFWSRQGVFVTSITATLAVGALWLALRALQTRRWIYLAGAAFLSGLGLYAKLSFVWVLGAAAVVGAAWIAGARRQHAAPPPAERAAPLQRTVAAVLACAASFAAGSAPLALYNLRTGGTFATLGTNLAQSYYGVNNLDFAPNLAVRLYELRFVLDGSHLWYLGATISNGVASWTYGLAAAVLLAAGAYAARSGRRWLLLAPAALALAMLVPEGKELGPVFETLVRPWTFVAAVAGLVLLLAAEPGAAARARIAPAAIIGLIVVESCFTVSDLFVTHFALLAPLVPLVAAAALSPDQTGPARGSLSSAVRRLAPALIIPLLASDAMSSLQYHAALARTGGLGSHSDAIYRLADLLASQPGPIVAADWGFATQVEYLTAGRTAPVEVFGYAPQADDSFSAAVRPWLARPGALFVFHTAAETVFARRQAFDALAADYGGTHLVATVSRRDGAPEFRVLALGP